MDQLAFYDSQVSEEADADVVIAGADVQSDQEEVPHELDIETQEYEEVVLDESVFKVEVVDRARSRSPRRPLILDIDNLPARTRRGGASRAVPEGPAPKATRGWTLEELSGVIEHLGLEGAWKQGGKEARAVYEGPDPSRPLYIINYEKSACWVQGKQAQAIDLRIRAARRQ